MDKKTRSAELQARLAELDEIRDGVRNTLRELLKLDAVVGRNPVRYSALYEQTVSAADGYMKACAILTAEITKLDDELSALYRLPAGTLLEPVRIDQFGEILETPDILTALELEASR